LSGVRLKEDILGTLFGIAEHVYKVWRKIPKTKILSQEVTINVPESTVDYTLAARIPKDFRSMRRLIKISAPSIIRVSASSLSPLPGTIRSAVKKAVYDDDSVVYALVPELIPKETELISMTINYKIDDISVLNDLVSRTKAHEPSGSDLNEYWLSAQLKHPKVLVDRFGRFDLNDVDVTIDVGVHNELKNAIPKSLTRRLKAFFDVMRETDPRKQYRAIPQLRRLAMQKTAGKEFKIIFDLDSLFLPGTFSKFIDVKRDFRYSGCYRGSECFELPVQIIPKKMNVISRADLTLEKPAADGILVYKNHLFTEEIRRLMIGI